ncbi:hypothetical protein [Kitasatospora sp. NPDC002040]|uniref:hypothetical protein n=1 Tax=Kitasatospora sp. NPDC002040 TaxID=3154661 RepID=UPI00332986CB
MLRDAVRGVVVVATEVAEEAGKRVAGLLERSGVNVAGLEQFPPSAKTLQTLAGEAVTAGRAGVDLAVGVARSEVEKVFELVGDQVVKVGVVLGYLESKLREVEEEPVPAPPQEARAGGLFDAGWEDEVRPTEPEPEPDDWAEADGWAETPAPAAPAVKRAAVKKAAVVKKTATAKKTAAADKAPVKKAAVKKTTAAKTTTVRTTAAKKTAAKKTAAKKTATKKAAPRKPADD